MVASTISNSGGPGSPNELSPVTIAVRDKVIEKFQDQPLREMNESLKMLLSREQDEQKRLGILAARVYILRQRITTLADPAPERVVSGTSPKLNDADAAHLADADAGDDANSEWTRLRIIDDCEVNGVRFPKTVIIDVKAADAQRLIDSGNAELVEDLPEPADDGAVATADGAGDGADDGNGAPSAMQAELDAATSDDAAADMPAEIAAMDAADDAAPTDIPDPDIPVMETSPAPEPDETDMAADAGSDEESKDAVIEAPSAAEVTAALEALGAGPDEPDDPAEAASKIDDVAELTAALTGASPPEPADAPASEEDEAAAVAAALEAAAAAMAAPSAPADAGDADGDADGDTDGDGKPSGWFEAQQNAEKAAKAETGDEQDDKGPADEKS